MSITSNTSMIESNNSIIQTIKTKLQNYTPGSGGESSNNMAKIFDSEEAMNNSVGNDIGDLAIVYSNQINNITEDTVFSSITFPSTVILPSAVSEYASAYGSCSGEPYVDLQCYIESASADITIMTSDNYYTIRYTSSDGKTYTRSSGDNIVDFGTEIDPDWHEFNDVVGYFIQTEQMTFGGLFNYSEYEDTTKIQFRPWSDATMDWTNRTVSFGNARLNGEYDIEKIRVCVEKACTDFGSDIYGQFVWLDEDGDICFWCLFNGSTYNKWCTNYMMNSDNSIKGVCYSTKTGWSSVDFRVYKLNLEDGTYSLKRSNVSYATVGSYWVADIKPMCIPGSFSSNTSGIMEQSFTLVNSSGSTTIYSFVEKEAYPIRNSYVRVDT